MPVLLSNEDVEQLLDVETSVRALESAVREWAHGDAAAIPRHNFFAPAGREGEVFQFGIMSGGSKNDQLYCLRILDDILYYQREGDTLTREKYCIEPGTYCGLLLLFSTANGELLGIMPDGVVQHMRVAGETAVGVDILANSDATTIGMLGSGGMARSFAEAISVVRDIRSIKVFSPTREHRKEYARDLTEKLGIDVQSVNGPREAIQGTDIVCLCTDSLRPVMSAEWLEPGQLVACVGGGGGSLDVGGDLSRFQGVLRHLDGRPCVCGGPGGRLHDWVFLLCRAAPRLRGNPPGGLVVRPGRAQQGDDAAAGRYDRGGGRALPEGRYPLSVRRGVYVRGVLCPGGPCLPGGEGEGAGTAASSGLVRPEGARLGPVDTSGNLGLPAPSFGGGFWFGVRCYPARTAWRVRTLPNPSRVRGGDGGGLWWRRPLSHRAHPPTFSRTRGLALYPRRELRPLHPARWRSRACVGGPGASLTFPRTWGQERGLMVAGAVVPPSPPSDVFQNRGTRCIPGGGCAPCAPCLGEGGAALFRLGAFQTLPSLPRVRGKEERFPLTRPWASSASTLFLKSLLLKFG